MQVKAVRSDDHRIPMGDMKPGQFGRICDGPEGSEWKIGYHVRCNNDYDGRDFVVLESGMTGKRAYSAGFFVHILPREEVLAALASVRPEPAGVPAIDVEEGRLVEVIRPGTNVHGRVGRIQTKADGRVMIYWVCGGFCDFSGSILVRPICAGDTLEVVEDP